MADAGLTTVCESNRTDTADVPEMEDVSMQHSVTATGPGEASASRPLGSVVVTSSLVMVERSSPEEAAAGQQQVEEPAMLDEGTPQAPATVTEPGTIEDQLSASNPICIVRQATKEREVIFVGVGGPSGIGKSTLVHDLCGAYGSPCTEIDMSCAFQKARHVPRYADLAASQDSSAPDDQKLDKNKMEDCLQQTLCYNVPEAIDDEKFMRTLIDLEEFFDNADHLPEEYHLRNHGNIIRKSFRNKKLDNNPIILFIVGPLLFAFPEIAKFMDVGIWLHLPSVDTIGERRYPRHYGKDPRVADRVSERLSKFLCAHREVDLKAYTRTLRIQHENADNSGAILVDAAPSADEVLDETTRQLDPVLLAAKQKWRKKQIPADKRKETERVRAEVELQHKKGNKQTETHESSVTDTGPKDDAQSSAAQDADSVTVTGPKEADYLAYLADGDFCASDIDDSMEERAQSPTPDPLGAFASLPKNGRHAPIARRANLSQAEADAQGVGLHVNRRARAFRHKRPKLLPARWVVKRPRLEPVAEEEEDREDDREKILLEAIRQHAHYDGQFKEDAIRYIQEHVRDTADLRFEPTVRQTYAAAAHAARKVATVAFTGDDDEDALFSGASETHWRWYIREVAGTYGTSTRTWKRLTRNRIRSQRHQLSLIRNNAAQRLFFWAGQIPYDPNYVAHPNKRRRHYSASERDRRAKRARKKAQKGKG